MAEEENVPQNVISFGDSIHNNCCTKCQKDLTYLFEAVQKEEIPFPNYCPACRAKFTRPSKIHKGLVCKKCRTLIKKPTETQFCTECGSEIFYGAVRPELSTQQEENQKGPSG